MVDGGRGGGRGRGGGEEGSRPCPGGRSSRLTIGGVMTFFTRNDILITNARDQKTSGRYRGDRRAKKRAGCWGTTTTAAGKRVSVSLCSCTYVAIYHSLHTHECSTSSSEAASAADVPSGTPPARPPSHTGQQDFPRPAPPALSHSASTSSI